MARNLDGEQLPNEWQEPVTRQNMSSDAERMGSPPSEKNMASCQTLFPRWTRYVIKFE
jgi:hypothetical protein